MPGMRSTRRRWMMAPLVALPACHTKPTANWDGTILQRAITAAALRFDPERSLIQAILGPERRFYTHMRDVRVHPLRESAEYALLLLKQGPSERAVKIAERVLALQAADGLWGYYAEEAPAQMTTPDPSWAAWIGSLLLEIARHHSALAKPVQTAVARAATYLRTLKRLLSDDGAAAAAAYVTGDMSRLDRIRLNNYLPSVLLAQLARIHHAAARRLERLAWEQLAGQWDAPRRQFAGPAHRAVSTDLGHPLWLEKGLHRRLGLATAEYGDGPEIAALDEFNCPDDLIARFLAPLTTHEHRNSNGTTYFSPAFSLGSAAHDDFSAQRRPLLAYFNGGHVRLRVVKDGYDFAAAELRATQQGARVRGRIEFNPRGGNRHPVLDPLPESGFTCGRLFAELSFDGLPEGFHHQLLGDRLEVRSRRLNARFTLFDARFGNVHPRLAATPAANSLTVTLDFQAPRHVRRLAIGQAFAEFLLELGIG